MNFDLPLFHAIDSFALHTLWLRGPVLLYSSFGVVPVAAILLGGWWHARTAAIAGGLLALSRVYIAAHYPNDVLAGLVLGAAVSLRGYLLLRSPLTAAVRGLERSKLRPLLTPAPPVPAAHSATRP